MRIEDHQQARPRPRGQWMRIEDHQQVRPRPRGQWMRIEHITADLRLPLRQMPHLPSPAREDAGAPPLVGFRFDMPHLPSPAREDAGAPVDHPLSCSFFLRQYALLHGQSSGLSQSLALTGLFSM
jgi:hypothetical protein